MCSTLHVSVLGGLRGFQERIDLFDLDLGEAQPQFRRPPHDILRRHRPFSFDEIIEFGFGEPRAEASPEIDCRARVLQYLGNERAIGARQPDIKSGSRAR